MPTPTIKYLDDLILSGEQVAVDESALYQETVAFSYGLHCRGCDWDRDKPLLLTQSLMTGFTCPRCGWWSKEKVYDRLVKG